MSASREELCLLWRVSMIREQWLDMSSVCSTLVEEGRVASNGGMSLIKDGRRGLGPVCVTYLEEGWALTASV